MPIGQLEPLYRYLKTNSNAEPVARLLRDIETLAKGGYVRSEEDGVLVTIDNAAIRGEIKSVVEDLVDKGERMAHHCMYQSVGKKMYISLSRISEFVSKTALSLTINEDDTVVVNWLEHDAIFGRGLVGKTLWNSISTVVTDDQGNSKCGFIRVETKVLTGDSNQTLALKADFKLSRTTPFYILITMCATNKPEAVLGATAKLGFERLESEWKA